MDNTISTSRTIAKIARLESLQGVELNEAKKVLATEVSALVHSRQEAVRLIEEFDVRTPSSEIMASNLSGGNQGTSGAFEVECYKPG